MLSFTFDSPSLKGVIYSQTLGETPGHYSRLYNYSLTHVHNKLSMLCNLLQKNGEVLAKSRKHVFALMTSYIWGHKAQPTTLSYLLHHLLPMGVDEGGRGTRLNLCRLKHDNVFNKRTGHQIQIWGVVGVWIPYSYFENRSLCLPLSISFPTRGSHRFIFSQDILKQRFFSL